MAKSIKSANRQGRPKSDEDNDEDDDDDDDDYKSMEDDDSDNDDNEDDDNDDDGDDDDDDDNDNNNNDVSEFAIGKGSNTKRIKKKIGGEYNDDKNFCAHQRVRKEI